MCCVWYSIQYCKPDPGSGVLGLLCGTSSKVLSLSTRPDGIGTVTAEEKEKFDEIKDRLRHLLENQIMHFR